MREKRRVLIGITGGIAAYKVPQLIRLLRKRGADVKAVCTPCALRFVGDETLRAVSGHPLYRDGVIHRDIEHIRLAEWTEIFCICPATANTIAKIAHGMADNLLTTLALAIPPGKTIVAPAMNTVMWQNRVTRENCGILEKRGVTLLPVGRGELACGKEGAGRMLEPAGIAEVIMARLAGGGLLKGKKVLVSSGPTEEPLDPVRVITNRSSGKMGAALAGAAINQGASVTVVSGPAAAALPSGARVKRVRTAEEMRAALHREFPKADICIMAAAVSDFRAARVSPAKMSRSKTGRLRLELIPNPDILAGLGEKKRSQFLVGFALESGDGEASAKRKMMGKGCDMMILNRVGESLARDDTRITIFEYDGKRARYPLMSKNDAAALIMRRVAAHLR